MALPYFRRCALLSQIVPAIYFLTFFYRGRLDTAARMSYLVRHPAQWVLYTAFVYPRTGFLSKPQKKPEQAVSLRKKQIHGCVPIRSHGRDPLHRGSASHKIDGVQAARGRLFFSEAEKSERGTVPMHRTGTAAAVNACRRTPQYTDGEQQFSDFQHHPAGRKQATACKPP